LLDLYFHLIISVVSEIDQVEPEYYYDLSSGQVLIGATAYETQIESGSHPADIQPLGEFLVADAEIESPRIRQNINGWPKDEILEAGRWLLTILPEPSEPKVKKINERILRRAGQLGIMPGYRQISAPARFGSFGEFYKQLGEIETHRTFIDWTDERVASYVGDLCEKYGRLPTVKEIRARAKADPTAPNYETIYNRFGGLIPAAEAAGKKPRITWTAAKLINWGVAFMIANEGLRPRTEDVDFFSKKGLCTSSSTLKKRFGGSFSEFQSEVEKIYQDLKENSSARRLYRKLIFEEAENQKTAPRQWVRQLRLPEDKRLRTESSRWDTGDFISWGIDFMKVNDGWVPTQKEMDQFSRKGLSNSATYAAKLFDGFTNYQQSLIEAYRNQLAREQQAKSQKLLEIEDGLLNGSLPRALFEGAETEEQQLVRYAKYKLARNILVNSKAEDHLKIALSSYGILQAIKRIDPSLLNSDIEVRALALDVFDDLWPSNPAPKKLKVKIKPTRMPVQNGLPKRVIPTRQIEKIQLPLAA